MRLYSPLVTPGSYMIVEDTSFEIDRSWEKLFVTFNLSGFLRRRDRS